MHRRADYFENPLKFDPDRWTKKNALDPNGYFYIPFYGGPQLCLGQSLALAEAKVAIVVLMRRFKFSFPDGFAPNPVKQIILRSANGLMVNIKEQ